ncbi:MAG: GrpB family protein [Clostridiales bacterium]|nr:GrpB family protein [Clostridiales bacterium]
MKIGLKRGLVEVVDHDPEWEEEAKLTIGKLDKILQGMAVDIQHVGSTAIKSICAKPIIDIAVGVRDLDKILEYNDALLAEGFIFRGEDIPGQYLYVLGDEDSRTHHIHVVKYDSTEWNNYINMRDYLNTHEEDAMRYSQLKESLALQYPSDRVKYTEMKSCLISEILNKAQIWRQNNKGEF